MAGILGAATLKTIATPGARVSPWTILIRIPRGWPPVSSGFESRL
jgi:hypothetical protein